MLEGEIRDLSRCPVDWDRVIGCPGYPFDTLYSEWVWAFAQVAVDGSSTDAVACCHQSMLTGVDLLGDVLGPDPAKAAMIRVNLADRRPRAERLYLNGVGRLGRLRFLPPLDHDGGKHSSRGMPIERLLEKSAQGGVSRFVKDFDEALLRMLFWDAFISYFEMANLASSELWPGADHLADASIVPVDEEEARSRSTIWSKFRGAGEVAFAVQCLCEVGASEGQRVGHLAMLVNLSAAVVHAYPVTQTEAERMMRGAPVAISDTAQGFFTR